MKKLFTIGFISLGLMSFAQTSKPTTATSGTTGASATQSTLTPKEKILCRTWVLSKTEVFGVEKGPQDDQKNDQLVVQENGRYRLIYNGVAEGGTWVLDKGGIWLTLTSDAGVVRKFKIVSMTEQQLQVDYKDSDDVHNNIYYVPVNADGTNKQK
ncbi:MAG TPA: hypothetical protein VFU15_12595 [Bacteroidia bacterium]|nr:hypothetical protein [Bacteroidia bacterium]